LATCRTGRSEFPVFIPRNIIENENPISLFELYSRRYGLKKVVESIDWRNLQPMDDLSPVRSSRLSRKGEAGIIPLSFQPNQVIVGKTDVSTVTSQ
jgi:hypothetical protein